MFAIHKRSISRSTTLNSLQHFFFSYFYASLLIFFHFHAQAYIGELDSNHHFFLAHTGMQRTIKLFFMSSVDSINGLEVSPRRVHLVVFQRFDKNSARSNRRKNFDTSGKQKKSISGQIDCAINQHRFGRARGSLRCIRRRKSVQKQRQEEKKLREKLPDDCLTGNV